MFSKQLYHPCIPPIDEVIAPRLKALLNERRELLLDVSQLVVGLEKEWNTEDVEGLVDFS